MDDECEFEHRMADLLQKFRARCEELNLVNAEVAEWHRESDRLRAIWEGPYQIYRKAYDEHQEFSKTGEPINCQIVEVRSEIQALQAQMLDLLAEHLSGGHHHPHERGEKHD